MASSLHTQRSLDFTEEINFLNKNLNDYINYEHTDNLIDSVIKKIIKYNNTIFKPWYLIINMKKISV
jgi:hypothetical protein